MRLEGRMRGTTTTKPKTTSVRLDMKLVDKAMRALGAKSRKEAVYMALEMSVSARHTQKARLKKYAVEDEARRTWDK